MDIQRGQITTVAIMLSIIIQGMGGFIANAQNVESSKTNFDYLTDVYGAFHGKGQDIPVDYSPRENITGYYSGDPLNRDDVMDIGQPSIYYDPTKDGMPNNYPYVNQRVNATSYHVKIEFTRATDREELQRYSITISNNDDSSQQKESFDFTSSIEMTKWFNLDRSDWHWPDIWHWYVSRIYQGEQQHNSPCGINIQELIQKSATFQGKSTIMFNPISTSLYPMFCGNLYYDVEDTTNTTWHTYKYSERQNQCNADISRDNVDMHGTKYAFNSVYLMWGDKDNREIEFNVTATDIDQTGRYINPNNGVSPMSTTGSYNYFVDVPKYSDSINGEFQLLNYHQVQTYGNIYQFTDKIYVKIGDGYQDEDGVWKERVYDTIPIAEFMYESHSYWEEEPSSAWSKFHVWQLDNDGNRVNETVINIVYGNNNYCPRLYFWTSSNIGDNHVYFRICQKYTPTGAETDVHEFNITSPRSFDYDITNPDGTTKTVRQIVNTYHNLSQNDQAVSSRTNAIYLHCSADSDLYQNTEWLPYDSIPTQTLSLKTWLVNTEIHTKTYDSETTYWYNGYNNSTVGMLVQTYKIIETTDIYGKKITYTELAPTKFNLKLHEPTTLEDYWVYGDQTKQSIIIYPDQAEGGMQYIGYVGADGVIHPMKAIGVCDYVYLEFRVVDNKVKLFQSPVYNFTNFMNFTPMGLIDVTDQISAVYGTLSAKSITEMSYYVPFDYSGETDPDTHEPIKTATYIPRQLVTKTIILLDGGGLYVEDGVLDYKSQFPQYEITEFIVNAVVHPGTSMTLSTNGTHIITIKNDGVDKWIYHKPNEDESAQKLYDWWDIKIFYTLKDKMYVEGDAELAGNHVYIQQGKWGSYDDWGELSDGNLTITMDGIWAFSTQYYTGQTKSWTHVEFAKFGEWNWTMNEFLVVFSGALICISSILMYTRGFNLVDLCTLGGQVALLWISCGV